MNIIYLHCHDAGRYLSPYGHRIDTPNLAHFASESVVFRQAFCAAPTCSPSRAALLTGQSAHASGMLGLQHRGFSLAHPERHLANCLGTAGYRCLLSGIQHVQAPGKPGWPYDEVLAPQAPGESLFDAPRDRRVAEAAAAFLRSEPASPFFLDCGFFLPHRVFPEPGDAIDASALLPPEGIPDNAVVREDMAGYHAAAAAMDEAFGIVWEALRNTGQLEDSFIFFTTDHGIAFPRHKCHLYDTGIGVALIMRPPGGKGERSASDALVSHLDVFPTLCDYAGLEPPAWLEGQSLRSILERMSDHVRDEVFSEVTYHAAYEPKRAVRTNRFKYIRNFELGYHPALPNIDPGGARSWMLENGLLRDQPAAEELYDLWSDPGERVNLASMASHTSELHELRLRLNDWMHRTEDPVLAGHVPAPAGARIAPPE